MPRSIRIGLLSRDKIERLSAGEITKAETLDPKGDRFFPVDGGLCCQKTFGSLQSGYCCDIYYSEYKKKEVRCKNCNSIVTDDKFRRTRMGHIHLEAPVVHPWFRQTISTLLSIPPKKLDAIIECEVFIVLEPGDTDFKRGQLLRPEEFYPLNENKKAIGNFLADTGGVAVKHLLETIDIDAVISILTRLKPSRRVNSRLRIAKWFKSSGTPPVNMVLELLPVLPPGLRPILVMSDGTIASSDLNDLYLRVICCNKRLKNFKETRAPEIFKTIERKRLQTAVDALIDNGKKQLVKNQSGRPLKSLTDMISTKQGRLRKNLLGKRVDYSGRSVIVVNPNLKLHQCGLPLKIASELFKPFVCGWLRRKGYADSLKMARKMVERGEPITIDGLEEVMSEKVVLLNRAPTLHRMGFQAFDPVLVPGKAIHLHPLVCSAYNADFDGDQMGVHLPLSDTAQIESRVLMMSTQNLVSPATGKISAAPSQDMVLGIYYLTKERPGQKGEGKIFSDKQDVLMALDHGVVDLHSIITVRIGNERFETTPGRVVFSEIFPRSVPFEMLNKTFRKKDLSKILSHIYKSEGKRVTVALVDDMKDMGYRYATLSGISFCSADATIPNDKANIIREAENKVETIREHFMAGQIAESERYNHIVDVWGRTTEALTKRMMEEFGVPQGESLSEEEKKDLKEWNSLFMMMDSGARGSVEQIRQLAGMRGLMAKPTGEIVEIPIKTNLIEGMTTFDFLLASHGARKGRVDGALKTANAGYFTRRLVSACHDVIINTEDCGTVRGIWVRSLMDGENEVMSLEERIIGRIAAREIYSKEGQIIVRRNTLFSPETAKMVVDEGLHKVYIRSPISCDLEHGICAMCYGEDLSTGELIEVGEAAGVIAGQSIGEPGTQLTLRTFHSGGAASGEARKSSVKAQAQGVLKFLNIKTVKNDEGMEVVVSRNAKALVIVGKREVDHGPVPYGAVLRHPDGAEIKAEDEIATWDPYNMLVVAVEGGKVEYKDIIEGVTARAEYDETEGTKKLVIERLTSSLLPRIIISGREHYLPIEAIIMVSDRESISPGHILARIPRKAAKSSDITGGLGRVLQLLETREIEEPAVFSEIDGTVTVHPPRGRVMSIEVEADDGQKAYYKMSADRQLNFYTGDRVSAGDILAEGVIDPRDVLRVMGADIAGAFLIDEVQKVYRGQGVDINDKHLEIVVKKMLGHVEVVSAGKTDMTAGDIVSRRQFLKENAKVILGHRATAKPTLLSLTDCGTKTDSWVGAASFQRTATVLVESSIRQMEDEMAGIAENVIIGNLIPAGTGHEKYLKTVLKRLKSTTPR